MNGPRQYTTIQARILVTHAEPTLRAQVIAILREDGHSLTEARSAREVPASMEASLPDLLILGLATAPGDLDLPVLLRDHPVRAAMATLILDHAPSGASFDAGADDVLWLPLHPQGLRLKVQTLLRLKLAERTARELLTRHHRDQQALQRAAQRLAACGTLAEALLATAEIVRANLGFDRVSVSLYDAGTQSLRNRVGTDAQGRIFSTPGQVIAVSLAPGSPLRDVPAYQALFEQGLHSYYVPDTNGRAPGYFRPFLDGPVREALLVALRTAAGPLGLIAVDNLPSGRPFGAQDAGLLVALAEQAALAIARVTLAEDLAARTREAEAIARMSAALSEILDLEVLYAAILQQAAAILPTEYAAMLTGDGDWARVAASLGGATPARSPALDLHGPAGAALAAARGSAIRIGDCVHESLWSDLPLWLGEPRLRAGLLAPIFEDQALIGAILVAGFTPDLYTAEHARLAARLAERTAQALRNTRRYEAERERARLAGEQAKQGTDVVALHIGEEWLLEDLQTLNQVDNGTLLLRTEPVPLRELVEQVAAEIRVRYPDLATALHGPDDMPAMADPGHARRALAALVDNAARHTASGTPVTITWGAEQGHVVVRVHDQGPGMASEARDRLFTRFGRSEHQAPEGRAGLGLGLYLARKLTEAMGGAVDLEESGTAGSTFLLALPLPPD